MARKIVVIPGDGIGKEITESAVAVMKKAAEKHHIDLTYEYHDAGGTAFSSVRSAATNGTMLSRH